MNVPQQIFMAAIVYVAAIIITGAVRGMMNGLGPRFCSAMWFIKGVMLPVTAASMIIIGVLFWHELGRLS